MILRILKALDKNAERWALLVFYIMLVMTMAIEVVRREWFAYSSIWGEEMVRYSFIYLVWIGAAAAFKDRAHIRIDVIMYYVPARIKGILYIFGDLVALGVACIAVYWSFETVKVSATFGSISHGLRISLVWFLMAVPIGFTLIIVRLIQSLIRDFRLMWQGKEPFEGSALFD